ncbi:type II toxin-antitoxin system RelB/DinJ family antitoxin [Patescibacteria group bacterium]
MATIQLRIDNATKKSAKNILDKLGIDMTSAIKIYLKQIVINEGIPFKLLTENGLTIEQEKELLKASAEAKKGIGVTKPMNPKKAVEHLKKL